MNHRWVRKATVVASLVAVSMVSFGATANAVSDKVTTTSAVSSVAGNGRVGPFGSEVECNMGRSIYFFASSPCYSINPGRNLPFEWYFHPK